MNAPRMISMLAAVGLLAATSPDKGVAVGHYSAAAKATLQRSHVHVLAPTRVPASWGHVYPVVLSMKAYDPSAKSGYQVVLAFVPQCQGQSSCAGGNVYAEKPPGMPNLALGSGARPAKLADGTPAKYFKGPCGGAGCADSSKLRFTKAGTQYTVAIKAGTLPEALLIANALRPASALP